MSIIALNQVIYKILGAERSSRLAFSWLGKLMIGNWDKEKIFSARKGIKLKLTKKEAFYLGIFHLGAVHFLETLVVEKILTKRDVIIDIGAYKDGWFSLLSAKIIGKKGHVYSFEPHPVFSKQLQENINLNGFTNITVEELAISDKKGRAPFYGAGLASSLFRDTLSKVYSFSPKPNFLVETTTLDSYTEKRNLKKVRFIKIDAGGAEMKVFRGAKSLLSSPSAPDIMVEISDSELKAGGSNRNEVLSYLDNFGYKPFNFTIEGLEPYSRKKGQTTLNLFFSKSPLPLSR